MIVYVVGTHGVGKTTFSCKVAPEAEVCFNLPTGKDEVYEQVADLPWMTIRVREGQKAQPEIQVGASSSFLRHDFSERELYRRWAGIPQDARVVRVSADALHASLLGGLSKTEAADAMRAFNDQLESCFDVVVHETYPRSPLREEDRVVALAAPLAEIRRRQSTSQWNGRLDLGRAHYIEAARMAAQPQHPYCYGANSSSRLWWANNRWMSVEEVAADRLKALGNWYHPHILAGLSSPDSAAASYDGRWRALRALFEEDLNGIRLLDIGANSGFNALRFAARGAAVVAVEPDSRVIEQFRAVVEMGTFPVSVTDRISYQNRAVETFDICELGQFDTVIMSACHYYINRSVKEPFKHPDQSLDLHGLRTPLWAVLDAIRRCSNRLLIPTNRAHADRPDNPYPDADPKWIKAALESVGYHDVTIYPGFADTPIVGAFSKKSFSNA